LRFDGAEPASLLSAAASATLLWSAMLLLLVARLLDACKPKMVAAREFARDSWRDELLWHLDAGAEEGLLLMPVGVSAMHAAVLLPCRTK
jgi:hypothetical protein